MSITSKIIKVAAPLPKIEEYESFLFVGPHPDDIEIGAGATAAKLAQAGKDITFLICTDGRYGDGFVDDSVTTEELIQMRKQESIASAEALGVTDVRFLDLSDGGFYEIKELEQGIARVVCDVNPDFIFCPDPSPISECHADHLNVGMACRKIACFAPYPGIMSKLCISADDAYNTEAFGKEEIPEDITNLPNNSALLPSADVAAIAFYMTAKPNQFVNTTGFFEQQKHSVFDIHLSQFPKDGPEASSVALYLKLRATEYGLTHFCKTAEGFRVLGQTQMHCLPEAGL